MSILNNQNRSGNFTSSQNYNLWAQGKRKMTEEELKKYKKENPKSRVTTCYDEQLFSPAGNTYIKQKKQERKRGRTLSMDASSKSTTWGDIMERRVVDMIGAEYHHTAARTTAHTEYPFWCGTPDLIVPNNRVGEIKGYEPTKFCDYADCILQKDLSILKKNFLQEYVQIVSNACIHKVSCGEIILYQPYDSEAPEILELIMYTLQEPSFGLSDNEKWSWESTANMISNYINNNQINNPFQPDNSKYPNLITWDFDIPEEDMEYLTRRIVCADKLAL